MPIDTPPRLPAADTPLSPVPDDLVILRYSDLEAAGLGSRSHINREVKAGRFPPPQQFGPGVIGWTVAKIRKYVTSCPTVTGGTRPTPAIEARQRNRRSRAAPAVQS